MALPIPSAKIGNANVSAIGYGAMGIGGAFYGANAGSDEERFKIFDRLYDLGERHIDSANVYGDSEELIGKWLKRSGKRNEMFIATKFAFVPSDFSIRGDPEWVHESFNESIKKLDIDYVDLFYMHRPDPKTPIEKTVGAMAELVKAGKVKYLGLSEVSVDTLRRAHKVHPIAAVQVEYSPFEIVIEKKRPGDDVSLKEACHQLGVAIVSYSPTGRGILTGSFKNGFDKDDFRANVPKLQKENWPNIDKLREGLESIAKNKGPEFTSAQVAIAWLVAQNTIPIPGSKQLKYVEENLKASLIKLTKEDLDRIRELVDIADKASDTLDRYPAGFMEMVFVDTPPLEA